MGFNPPVPQRDSNWEIRVAVLLSLAFQVVLIFTGPLRKRSSSPLIRFVIWSCYLLADWVADLALGLLLNNMGSIGGGGGGSSCDMAIPSTAALKHAPHGGVATTTSGSGSFGGAGRGGSPIIFAFWAPFLLLHLGGPDTITAYALADNELWLRHLIGLLFELSAAAVVFLCSLQGNPMILPTVLMFIAGIIKYGERTYSLYTGSTDGFTASILGNPEIQSTNIPRLMQAYSSRLKAGLLVEMVTIGNREALWDVYGGEGKALSQVEYDGADEVRAYNLFVHFRSLFVNGTISMKSQRTCEAFYLAHGRSDPMEAFRILELELNYTYDMLYTKMPVLSTTAGYVLRFVGCGCVVSSLVIFRGHDKAGLLPVDAGVTYALLITAVALEAAALIMLLFSNWTVVFIHQSIRFTGFKWLSWLVSSITKAKRCWRRWTWSGSEKAWRMNLIDHSIPTRVPADCSGFLLTPLTNAAASFIDKIRHRDGPLGHTKIGKEEYRHLLAFIFNRIGDTVTKATCTKERKASCETRGERAILRELKECIHPDESHIIESTVIFRSVTERDFDESLLLWHIATDLCLNATAPTLEACKMRTVSTCLSEYMLYLLLNKPEMMSATMGIGQLRYRNTHAAARLLLGSLRSDIIDHQSACHRVLSMETSTFEDSFVQGDRTKTVLFNACILAKALMKTIADPDAMWRVVAHVWVEMLTFSAARTPAREHLRQLSDGGELITVVWFLMAHMGMSSSLFVAQETESLNKLIIIDQ